MALAALIIGGMVVAVPERAAAAPVPADEVYKALGVDEVAASYVIAVDTSGSMRAGNLYADVRTSLRQFFAALAPNDLVSLVTFADGARLIWQGQAGRAPDDLVAKLPAAPGGQHTDIGAGITKAVEVLEGQREIGVAGVVLLTDGQHEPPSGSEFPFAEGYAWTQLKRRGAALPQRITSFAIQLRGANGAGLLRTVLPQTEVLNPSGVGRLVDRLATAKAAVRAEKARDLIESDLSGGVVVEWPAGLGGIAAGTNQFALTLRATTAKTPIEVSGLTVRSDSPAVRAEVRAGSVVIPPGATATVPLIVYWDAGPTSWQPRKQVAHRYGLTLECTLGTPWSETLTRDLGVEFKPALSGAAASGQGSAERGRPGAWWGALAVLLLLVAGALVLRWWRLHPTPGGLLVAMPGGSGESTGSMRLRSRRSTISAGSLGVGGSGSIATRRAGVWSPERFLTISYSPDGSREHVETGDLPAGGSADVGGVRFEWRV